MTALFISRKSLSSIGGLSRFAKELTSHFPYPYHLLSPTSLIPSITRISHIHLCDATLLPLGILLKFFFRKPLTLTAHGLDLTYPNPIYQLMLGLLLPKANAIILDSHAARVLLLPFNIPERKIFIIPPGISIKHLKSPNTPNFPNLPNPKNNLVILTVGNLVKRKGHVWFIKNVFSKLPDDFVYLIVGDGPQRSEIERLVSKLNLTSRVYILSRLTDPQLAFIFKLAHIYLAPNQHQDGNFEGFGIACGEAAALGLPVVASNVDGIPEIIKHGKNGLLVNSIPESFIDAITSLKIGKKRKSFGTKAAVYTKKHFTWQKTSQQYLKLFQKLIDKS